MWRCVYARRKVPPGGAGVALLLVTNSSVIVPLNAVGIALLALSVTQATLTIGNRFVFACLVALCLLSTVGAIGAIPWGYGHPVQSAAIAVTSWMGLLLYCSGVTERFWQWVTAGVFVHAAATIWQGLLHYREPFYRATGLSDNPDPAAGYLDVAIVYLLVKGKWWATAPLILALHFTGTRLAFWGFLTIVLAMGLRKVLGWRQVAVLLAATFLFSAVLWPYSGRLYRLHDIKAEVVARAEGPPGIPKTHILPGILPQGYAGDKGYHVAPLRLLREIGWVGLGAWALVSGVAVPGVPPLVVNPVAPGAGQPGLLHHHAAGQPTVVGSMEGVLTLPNNQLINIGNYPLEPLKESHFSTSMISSQCLGRHR